MTKRPTLKGRGAEIFFETVKKKEKGKSRDATTAIAAKDKRKKIKPMKKKIKPMKRIKEENLEISDIIEDLGGQWDGAVAARDALEEKIGKLRKEIKDKADKTTELENKVKKLEGLLVSQEELNSEIEFLENEQLAASEKIQSLREELKQKEVEIKEKDKKIPGLQQQVKDLNERNEQLQFQAENSTRTTQEFQHQLIALEKENEEKISRVEDLEFNWNKTSAEKNKLEEECKKFKERLEKIKLMLASAHAKVREHRYLHKLKK